LKFSTVKATKSQSVQAEITVKNEGKMKGDEVVQLYLTRENGNTVTPLFSLKGFQRIHLKPGESKKVIFNITPAMLSIIDEQGNDKPESGKVKVFIGGSLPVQRSLDLSMGKVMEGMIEIVD
jgi:beta-glucosidase